MITALVIFLGIVALKLVFNYSRYVRLSCLLTPSACSITSFVVILPVYCQAVERRVCMTLFIDISSFEARTIVSRDRRLFVAGRYHARR